MPRVAPFALRFATTESAGAAAGKGSGLTGLVDRVEALGGTMTIQSPPGNGTSVLVDIRSTPPKRALISTVAIGHMAVNSS